ncbi:MAG: hypothetical protein Q8900_12390 [Bacillota bacterium]|nr:hypothetical protein [Bacillota bacterium]
MKNTKKIISILILSAIALTGAGCSRTSTGNNEANGALTSFNKIVKTYPNNKGFHKTLQHWGLKLSGDNKFEWTKDTSANKIDFAMVIEADPLIKAGLDVKKLDEKDFVFKPAATEDAVKLSNRIVHPYNVSDKKEFSSGSEDAFRRLLKQDLSLVKYNKDENIYVLNLGNSYEVEWPENIDNSDETLKFVIPAEKLTKAGLDINKLEGTGWKIEKVNSGNSNKDQLVKSFILK